MAILLDPGSRESSVEEKISGVLMEDVISIDFVHCFMDLLNHLLPAQHATNSSDFNVFL